MNSYNTIYCKGQEEANFWNIELFFSSLSLTEKLTPSFPEPWLREENTMQRKMQLFMRSPSSSLCFQVKSSPKFRGGIAGRRSGLQVLWLRNPRNDGNLVATTSRNNHRLLRKARSTKEVLHILVGFARRLETSVKALSHAGHLKQNRQLIDQQKSTPC